jgi:ssDNA-binding Zn-finger/Zn-ribbon topoisomerase 1
MDGTYVHRREGTPICPKCGTQMVIRTAKKRNQKGEEFWGCRSYPKCREIVQI